MADIRTIFNEAAAGTKYAPPVDAAGRFFGIKLDDGFDVGITIDHPAGLDATYSVEVSNLTEHEVNAKYDDWTLYDQIAALNIAAAAKRYIEIIDLPFARARIKIVTNSGAGTPKLRSCGKPRR